MQDIEPAPLTRAACGVFEILDQAARGSVAPRLALTHNEEMRKQGGTRNPMFTKRWFSDEVIITCVRWYLRFRLSYRDLSSIAAELGIAAGTWAYLYRAVDKEGKTVDSS